jgi:hypothetical protein
VHGTGTPKWAEGVSHPGGARWGAGGWMRSTLGQLCGLGAEPGALSCGLLGEQLLLMTSFSDGLSALRV